jgi:phage tail-like protein
MARAAATDPLHSFRFHVTAGNVDGLDGDPLQPGAGHDAGGIIGEQAQSGFQAVTTPEYTVEVAEYREGVKTYTEKYPGIPTTNDITLTRGAAKADTAFFDWVLAAIEGAEYRSDVSVFHATRAGRSFPYDATADFAASNSKLYRLFNAVPIRVKVAADMDASTSDVSLAEIDIAYERFTLAPPTA